MSLLFITDGMLGKLTRWLRMLGNDVSYYHGMDDKRLMDIAEMENRTLLTRDRELYKRAIKFGVAAFLIEYTDLEKQLAFLAKKFGFKLEIDLDISRCPKCNSNLLMVSKKEVYNMIPEETSIHYNDFWRCTFCGQIYWKGAHWNRIQATLDDAKEQLKLL